MRPGGVPRFWRIVDDGARDRKTLPPPHLFDLWIAVLASRAIPYRLSGRGNRLRLYVPALLEQLSRRELAEVRAEAKPPAVVPEPLPVRNNAHGVLALLLLLILWHGVRMGWGFLPQLPGVPHLSPEAWVQHGAADVFRIRTLHEWYRCVTALTLHSDSPHLFGNVLFGTPFLVLLCRRVGLGTGLLMVVLAGALGNVCNALYRPFGHVSLGFSTALFGTVGALSGVLALHSLENRLSWRRSVVLLAAGAGILAMLGTEGDNTDYAAHLFGLLAGFAVGGLTGLLSRNRHSSPLREAVLGCLACILVVLCWHLAL